MDLAGGNAASKCGLTPQYEGLQRLPADKAGAPALDRLAAFLGRAVG